MGFSTEDCKKALDLNKMNLTEAAKWLTDNVTPEEGRLNITGIDVSVRGPRRGSQYYRDRCKQEGSKGGGINIIGVDISIRSPEWGTQYHRDRCKCEGPKEGDAVL